MYAITAQVWSLADVNKDGKLDQKEYVIAMHLINLAVQGQQLPAALPPWMLAAAAGDAGGLSARLFLKKASAAADGGGRQRDRDGIAEGAGVRGRSGVVEPPGAVSFSLGEGTRSAAHASTPARGRARPAPTRTCL